MTLGIIRRLVDWARKVEILINNHNKTTKSKQKLKYTFVAFKLLHDNQPRSTGKLYPRKLMIVAICHELNHQSCICISFWWEMKLCDSSESMVWSEYSELQPRANWKAPIALQSSPNPITGSPNWTTSIVATLFNILSVNWSFSCTLRHIARLAAFSIKNVCSTSGGCRTP